MSKPRDQRCKCLGIHLSEYAWWVAIVSALCRDAEMATHGVVVAAALAVSRSSSSSSGSSSSIGSSKSSVVGAMAPAVNRSELK